MPVAYLPSPASAVWHLGAIPVRAYALSMIAGVVVGLWLTDLRYRTAGGQAGVVLDVATIAVPVGLIGARIYSVLSSFGRYFGPGRDWTDVLRVWDGGMGVAGAVAAGALAAFVYCRQAGIEVGPIALAAAPALAVAQAISIWGNWFSQELYGSPSGLPWAVAISPLHRAAGFQAFSTFQPLFLYESALDLLVALAVIYAIGRFVLSGGRAFALYAALWAAAGCATEALRIDYSPTMFGLRTNILAMLVVLVVACGYLTASRPRRRERPVGPPDEQPVSQRTLRQRSSRATAEELTRGRLGEPGEPPPSTMPGPSLQV
jgi:prolipoprotein diacylglyceryl transferase